MKLPRYTLCRKNTLTVYTVDSRIVRAFAIILAIFLWFDCQFFSSHAWLVVAARPIVRLWDLGLQGECSPWGSIRKRERKVIFLTIVKTVNFFVLISIKTLPIICPFHKKMLFFRILIDVFNYFFSVIKT